jgi:hypothetical protein
MVAQKPAHDDSATVSAQRNGTDNASPFGQPVLVNGALEGVCEDLPAVGAEIIVGLDRIAALAAFVCVMLWIAHTGHASLAQPPNGRGLAAVLRIFKLH